MSVYGHNNIDVLEGYLHKIYNTHTNASRDNWIEERVTLTQQHYYDNNTAMYTT